MPWVLVSNSLVYILEPVPSAMQSSWSVLTVIFCMSKELQSSTRAHFHSVLWLSGSCPHTSWLLLLILFSWASIQRLPFLSLHVGSLYGHHFCVWAWDGISRGCVHVRVIHILPWWLWVQGGMIPSTLQAPCHSPILHIKGGAGWTGGGLTGSCPHCLELVPVAGINLGVSLLPCTELCKLLVLTSWELTQILLLHWWASKLLWEWSCFFCVEMAMNSANGCPHWGSAYQGDIWQEMYWTRWSSGWMKWTAWGAWSPWALRLRQSRNVLILLHRSGHHSTCIAEGHFCRNPPRQ